MVTFSSVNDFRKIKSLFEDQKVSFYTHQLADDRTTKVVVFGLPVMDLHDIKSALEENNVNPIAVKSLAIKNKRYSDQAMYLLHFTKGSIILAELKNVRAINHHRVYFEYYNQKKRANPVFKLPKIWPW